MPFFANQSRNQLRQLYIDAWNKQQNSLPQSPLETQIADVVGIHPEYHSLFANADKILDRDWTPEQGATNPFLHMGLHLAIREQIATDRPAGIRAVYQQLLTKDNAHNTEHRMIECLAEAMWNAQRSDTPPDEQAYLATLRSL